MIIRVPPKKFCTRCLFSRKLHNWNRLLLRDDGIFSVEFCISNLQASRPGMPLPRSTRSYDEKGFKESKYHFVDFYSFVYSFRYSRYKSLKIVPCSE